MRTPAAALLGLLIPAFLAAGIAANPAIAQDKAYEVTYAPGAENKGIASTTMRIVRGLKGGTLERTYADGKKELVRWKAGEVKQVNPGPAYTTKNIGKGELQLYVVQLK